MKKRFHIFLLVPVLFSASLTVAWAQAGFLQRMALHVEEAASAALAHNPTVLEARMQWLITRSQEGAAWGDFEPSIVSNYAQSALDRLNNASEQVAELGRSEYSETKEQFDVGLNGKFFTGASYHLGYSLSKTDSVLTNGDEYESSVGLNVEQPILKGVSHWASLASVRIAGLDTLIAFHKLRKQLITVVSGVESAYWDLALAQERRRLAAESVSISGEILRDARERELVGKMSELDFREAETRYNVRLAEQDDREQEELEAATRLQLLVAEETLGSAIISVADPLAVEAWDRERFQVESSTLRERALALQPEIAIRQAELEKETIRLEYARDQQLPELNAKASYGFQGLGSSVDSAFQRLNSQGYPFWSVGVELKIPTLGDIKSRNAEQAAQLSKTLALNQLASTKREIALSVEALTRRVFSSSKQIESARAESAFKKQLLDVEMARFEAGQSDVRKLYDMEDGLSQARAKEMQSYNRFRKALLDLSATSGTLLQERGWETVRGSQILLSGSITKSPRP